MSDVISSVRVIGMRNYILKYGKGDLHVTHKDQELKLGPVH